MKLAERNAKILGKAASDVQLSELALFGLKAGVRYQRPIVGIRGKVEDWGGRGDLKRYRDRRGDLKANFRNLGGLTFVTLCKWDRDTPLISTIGVACCRDDEEFSSHTGREIALKRAMRQLPSRSSEPSPLPEETMPESPHTPREGLLMIRRLIAGEPDTRRDVIHDLIDRAAAEALALENPATFELTDRLATHLAKAHEALRRTKAWMPQASLSAVAEVLVLPPDLEAIIDLRLPRGRED